VDSEGAQNRPPAAGSAQDMMLSIASLAVGAQRQQ
jgi:hypothetical protein